jgi:heterodisulfide reductase subunit A
MSRHVVVIGAGVAGMEAAGQLSKAGFEVSLVEKDIKTGGHLNDWYKLFPDRRDSSEVKDYLDRITRLNSIRFIPGTEVEKISRINDNLTLKTTEGTEMAADAVIVATGFDLFKAARKEEYGYDIYDNVITSSELESMFCKGKITMADGSVPAKVGFLHCVGSRDEKVGNYYCSKLCCVTAVKQAIEIREHLPESRVFCFYMDMRMGGAYYEELYREAQEVWGVNFIRGKISEVGESINKNLIIKSEDTLAGRPLKMELDMLVLMSGMEMAESGKKLAVSSGLNVGENRFFSSEDHHFGSNLSNMQGVFYAGSCTAPMNIPDTISHARAAVSDVMDYFNLRK